MQCLENFHKFCQLVEKQQAKLRNEKLKSALESVEAKSEEHLDEEELDIKDVEVLIPNPEQIMVELSETSKEFEYADDHSDFESLGRIYFS